MARLARIGIPYVPHRVTQLELSIVSPEFSPEFPKYCVPGIPSVNSYDEYGKPGASNSGRFQYTGQRWLPEIGAYHYKARVYLPHLGIFAQTDPIGYAGSPNLYAYVLNDPVNLVDPLGFCAEGWVPVQDITGTPAGSGPGGGPVITAQYHCVRLLNKETLGGAGGTNVGPSVGGGGGKKTQCIAPSDGPVYIKGGTFTMTMILGGSFTVGKFEIPSIGASGWFSSGGANLGWEGFVGGTYGVIDTFGDFAGTGVNSSFNIRGLIGGSFGFSKNSTTGIPPGSHLSSSSVSAGPGGGASLSYGGVHIKSSNIPPCNVVK